jgi:hypothetical protein
MRFLARLSFLLISLVPGKWLILWEHQQQEQTLGSPGIASWLKTLP